MSRTTTCCPDVTRTIELPSGQNASIVSRSTAIRNVVEAGAGRGATDIPEAVGVAGRVATNHQPDGFDRPKPGLSRALSKPRRWARAMRRPVPVPRTTTATNCPQLYALGPPCRKAAVERPVILLPPLMVSTQKSASAPSDPTTATRRVRFAAALPFKRSVPPCRAARAAVPATANGRHSASAQWAMARPTMVACCEAPRTPGIRPSAASRRPVEATAPIERAVSWMAPRQTLYRRRLWRHRRRRPKSLRCHRAPQRSCRRLWRRPASPPPRWAAARPSWCP